MLEVEPFILDVPDLKAIVHKEAGDPVLGDKAQLYVGYTDLTERKNLLQAIVSTLNIIDIDMRITCISETS